MSVEVEEDECAVLLPLEALRDSGTIQYPSKCVVHIVFVTCIVKRTERATRPAPTRVVFSARNVHVLFSIYPRIRSPHAYLKISPLIGIYLVSLCTLSCPFNLPQSVFFLLSLRALCCTTIVPPPPTRPRLRKQLIGAKVTSATPGSIGDQTRKEAEFIKYTPNPNAPGYNNNAKQRVVRMVAAQVRRRSRDERRENDWCLRRRDGREGCFVLSFFFLVGFIRGISRGTICGSNPFSGCPWCRKSFVGCGA